MNLSQLRKVVFTTLTIVLLLSTIELSNHHTYASENLGANIYKQKFQVAPGVTLTKENYETSRTRHAINYMQVDLNHSDISVEIALGNPINQFTKITDLAKRETIPELNRYVIGSINASFFLTNGSGLPSNLVVRNNEIIRLGKTSSTLNDPLYYRNAFGIDRNGKPLIGSYKEDMKLHINGKSFPINSFNSSRNPDQIILYTPSLGYNVPIDNNYSTEIIVEYATKDTSSLSFGDNVRGTVTRVVRNNRTQPLPIPANGFVIAANGMNLVGELSTVQVGDEISFTLNIDDKWMNSQSMIATGPILVKDGQVSLSMNPLSSFAKSLHPRSAIGITKDNKLILVTVDGRQIGYSNGLSLEELAKYMKSLGVVSAINLDGGGSTTMAARLRGHNLAYLVNRPSDGAERKVSNAIQIISTIPSEKVNESVIKLETFTSLKNWESAGLKGVGEVSLAAINSNQGNQSVKLSYDFLTNKQEGTSAAYLIPKQPILLEGKPYKIGMWVYGDGRENWLRMQLTDRNLKSHYVNFTQENKLNWSGWKYVTAEIPLNIQEPYSISRVYIAQALDTKKSMGIIYLNNLEAIYDSNFINSTPPTHNPIQGLFPDVKDSHWGEKEIAYLAHQRVISGYPSGIFHPEGNITREQVALMLVRQLNLNVDDVQAVSYKDVSENSYYYRAIAAATHEGILTGRSEGYFNPKETLTRAEAAAVLTRAYNLTGEKELTFSDAANHWAYSYISTLASQGVTTGYPNGTFAPEKPVTRAEFSAFLYRSLGITPN